ncbi:MAG: M6 family metalloprotease domain-containing protein [Muribaculum sp.]|nr:M6 family metalloprotease domain-containing protein [Muribaculum sp.]
MMKKSTFVLAAITLGVIFSTAEAKKAVPHPIVVTQPDGTQLTVSLRGDERSHDFYTTDNHLIIRNSEGFFCYARVGADGLPEASSLRVNPLVKPVFSAAETNALREAAARKTRAIGDKPKYIFSGNAFPCTGSPHGLVILVQYQDKKFSMDDPHDYFNRMLNSENFTDNGATGSARSYFIENSNGLFTPTFDVYGPVTLKNKMSYYGKNDGWDQDLHPEEMVIEAVQQLDSSVDFSIYDNDGDGYIDNVYVFYAGYGEADSGISNTVWPHSVDMADYMKNLPVVDGVRPNRYAMSNEVDYSYRRPDGIGTFVHEFSHVLGLPDLYNTQEWTYDTPGDWSCLDSGPYNNQGRTPPNYSIHERYALNWMEPEVLKYTGDYTLQPIDVSNKGYIIPTERSDEFFLVECRRPVGNDKYIPGYGMLVWHIDFNQNVWNKNEVNDDPTHLYVDLIEADGKHNTEDEDSYDGDSFPGSNNVTEFSFTTTPALKSWAEKTTGLAFSKIAITDDYNLTFRLDGEEDNSAVSEIYGDKDIICNGHIITVDSDARIYDLTGRHLFTLGAGESIEITAKGIYIVSLQGRARKVIIR